MVCSFDFCPQAECAFLSQDEFRRSFESFQAATLDCVQPPSNCGPLVTRYAKAGIFGTCGKNELARGWVEQVCRTVPSSLQQCDHVSNNKDAVYLLAMIVIAVVVLTARALRR